MIHSQETANYKLRHNTYVHITLPITLSVYWEIQTTMRSQVSDERPPIMQGYYASMSEGYGVAL